MFVHHVFFWMKEGADHDYFEAQLKVLVTIDLIRNSNVGKVAVSERDVVESSYHFSLLCFFDNKADHDAYQDHPDHHVFVANCKDLWAKVRVFDSVDV